MTSLPIIPAFVEGVHYERHAPFGRWKWVTKKPLEIRFVTPLLKAADSVAGEDRWCREWLRVEPLRIAIPAGYAWNGSSWSPDLSGVMLASCVHDALYQFSGCSGWPSALDRKWADDLFHQLSTSRLRWFYRVGIAACSWLCWGRPPEENERVIRIRPET